MKEAGRATRGRNQVHCRKGRTLIKPGVGKGGKGQDMFSGGVLPSTRPSADISLGREGAKERKRSISQFVAREKRTGHRRGVFQKGRRAGNCEHREEGE